MKATLVGQLPAGNEWLYEIKWDGYRALAAKRGNSVRLLSLKNKNLSNDFPAVMEAVRGVAAETVLIDGEIVAVDKRGCPSFQMLQNRASLGRDWQIVYYAFDLLELEGEDWKARPLTERKGRLQQLLSGSEVRYNAELLGSPEAVVRTVRQAGLEGVIAKRRDSIYRASTRSKAWLKLKLDKLSSPPRSREMCIECSMRSSPPCRSRLFWRFRPKGIPAIDTAVPFTDGTVTGSIAKAGSFRGPALIVPAGVDAGLIGSWQPLGVWLVPSVKWLLPALCPRSV